MKRPRQVTGLIPPGRPSLGTWKARPESQMLPARLGGTRVTQRFVVLSKVVVALVDSQRYPLAAPNSSALAVILWIAP